MRSRSFRLPEGQTSVAITAETGSTSTTVWGAIMAIGGGGIAVFVGLPLLLAGALANSIDDTTDEFDRTDDDLDGSGLVLAGTVVTLGGVALGIGGLVMLSGNSTTVDVSRVQSAPRIALPGGFELGPRGFTF